MKSLRIILFLFAINSHLIYSKWEFISYVSVPTKESKLIINNGESTVFYKDESNIFHIKESNKNDFKTTKSIKWIIQEVIEYKDNYIVSSVSDIYFFNKLNLEFEKEIKLKSLAFNAKQIDSNLYFYASNVSLCKYNAHSIINLYNPYTNSENQIKFSQFPDDIQMTLFGPRKLMSISNEQIIISNMTNYSFNEFDLEGNYINNFKNKDMNWIPISGQLTENYCNSQLISILMKDQHYVNECSQIWLTNFINDTTFLLTWDIPVKESKKEVTFDFYHDIWIKKGHKWILKETTSEISKKKPQVLDDKAIHFKWDYNISNGYLYIIKPFPKHLVEKHFGKSYSDFDKEMNNFYVENDLQYTCFIYKYIK